jgi:hypothetical protein
MASSAQEADQDQGRRYHQWLHIFKLRGLKGFGMILNLHYI